MSRSWAPHTPNDPPYDTAFYGEKGTLGFSGASYRMFDLAGRELAKGSSPGSNDVHTQNFVDATAPDDGDLNRPSQVFVPEADYPRAHQLFYTEREDEL